MKKYVNDFETFVRTKLNESAEFAETEDTTEEVDATEKSEEAKKSTYDVMSDFRTALADLQNNMVNLMSNESTKEELLGLIAEVETISDQAFELTNKISKLLKANLPKDSADRIYY